MSDVVNKEAAEHAESLGSFDLMRALPEDEKGVPIQIKFEDEDVIPRGTKCVWPYMCKRG